MKQVMMAALLLMASARAPAEPAFAYPISGSAPAYVDPYDPMPGPGYIWMSHPRYDLGLASSPPGLASGLGVPGRSRLPPAGAGVGLDEPSPPRVGRVSPSTGLAPRVVIGGTPLTSSISGGLRPPGGRIGAGLPADAPDAAPAGLGSLQASACGRGPYSSALSIRGATSLRFTWIVVPAGDMERHRAFQLLGVSVSRDSRSTP